jgi:hypothetical protein
MSKSEARKAKFEDEFSEAVVAPDAAPHIEPSELDDEPLPESLAEAVTEQTEEPPEPSWFSRTYNVASPEEMAERYMQSYDEAMSQAAFATPSPEAYNAYQRRLEERFRTAQTMADPVYATLPVARQARVAASAPKRPMRAPFAPHLQSRRERAPVRTGMVSAIVLTILACGIGGAGGYVAANPGAMASMLSNPASAMSNLYAGLVKSGTPDATQTTLNKVAPVARIDVADVSGPVNGPIPLSIATFPVNADTPISIRISGLPPEAYLTKGVAVAEGAWLVKSGEIARAELVVPRSTTSLLGLEVAALDEKTGQQAAPPQQMNVALDLAAVPLPGAVPPPEQMADQAKDVKVVPVSAEPDQGFNHPAEIVPVPLEAVNAEATGLLAKGRMLLKHGDLIAARQYFLKAHALKLPEAAYYVGQTYDPATFNALRVVGLQPDIQLASEWYGKAAAQGVVAANEAMTKLSAK